MKDMDIIPPPWEVPTDALGLVNVCTRFLLLLAVPAQADALGSFFFFFSTFDQIIPAYPGCDIKIVG